MSIHLTSDLIVDAVLAQSPTLEQLEIKLANEKIIETIGEFEERAWYGGLRTYVQQATMKGHRCDVAEHVDILLYAIMGRVLITFRDTRTRSEITLITAENATTCKMGMQSIDASLEEALQFLKGAMRLAEHDALHFEPYAGTSII